MAGAGPGDVHALALELLGHMEDALNTIPDTEPQLDGSPSRSFVSPGRPVWDCCEMVAVHVEAVATATVGPQGEAAGLKPKFGMITHVTFVGTVGRCIPTGIESSTGTYSPPSAQALTDSAEQINADGWALWNHLYNVIRSGEFLTLCTEVFFDGLVPSLPTGGCAGWTAVVRVRLDGYEESIGS